MQTINFLHRLSTNDRTARREQPIGGTSPSSLYLFCLLQLTIPMAAGYLLTRSDVSSQVKLLFLGLALLTSMALLFQYVYARSQDVEHRSEA